MLKLAASVAVFSALLFSSVAEAQWSVNDTSGGPLVVTNLSSGEATEYSPPANLTVVRVLGFDATTGLLWLEGWVEGGSNNGFITFDPASGQFEYRATADRIFNGFEAGFIPQFSSPALSEGFVIDQSQAAASLAGILDIAPPGEGQENFVNFSTNSVNGSEAYGVSYARNVGRWRFGAAYGRNDRGDDAGKVQAGFGW